MDQDYSSKMEEIEGIHEIMGTKGYSWFMREVKRLKKNAEIDIQKVSTLHELGIEQGKLKAIHLIEIYFEGADDRARSLKETESQFTE